MLLEVLVVPRSLVVPRCPLSVYETCGVVSITSLFMCLEKIQVKLIAAILR